MISRYLSRYTSFHVLKIIITIASYTKTDITSYALICKRNVGRLKYSGEKMKVAFEFLLVQFNYARKKRITNTKLFSTVNYIVIIIRNKTIVNVKIQGYKFP